MARYYGTVHGRRDGKRATRCGTRNSGLEVTARGWHVGVTAEARPMPTNPEADAVYLTADYGSSGLQPGVSLGFVAIGDYGPRLYPSRQVREWVLEDASVSELQAALATCLKRATP